MKKDWVIRDGLDVKYWMIKKIPRGQGLGDKEILQGQGNAWQSGNG